MSIIDEQTHPLEATNDLLVEVATRFYSQDQSKVLIAKNLGLSRFKVARLLQEARNRGIVKITITPPLLSDQTQLEALRAHLGLDQILLVASSPTLDQERDALGKAAAELLVSSVKKGQRIGFSWGRTLLPMANHLEMLPSVELVQLTGVVGNDPSQSPIAFLSDLSIRSGSTAKALFAPLLCATPESARAQRSEPAVAEVLALYNHLDMAFLSVGSWTPRVTQLAQHLTAAETQMLDEVGTVADFSGQFFDREGRYVLTPINDRRISVNIDQLLATPQVVAVAGQLDKVKAIHSVCMSGLPTCLVTTDEVARALLEMEPVTTPAYRR